MCMIQLRELQFHPDYGEGYAFNRFLFAGKLFEADFAVEGEAFCVFGFDFEAELVGAGEGGDAGVEQHGADAATLVGGQDVEPADGNDFVVAAGRGQQAQDGVVFVFGQGEVDVFSFDLGGERFGTVPERGDLVDDIYWHEGAIGVDPGAAEHLLDL